jgi:hypothetical protein
MLTLTALRTVRTPSRRAVTQFRMAATHAQKRAGDISDAFVSLSGQKFEPLTPEYADLKGRLIKGYESEVRESWDRLLKSIREEIPLIAERGSQVIPDIDFKDLDHAPESFSSEFRKRGVAVVRNVVPEQEVLQWKDDLKEYIRQNPQTKGGYGQCTMSLNADKRTSFSCRQPTSLRIILVKDPAAHPRPSKPLENASLPHVLLAHLEPGCASVDPPPDQLCGPLAHAPPRRRQVCPGPTCGWRECRALG